MFAHKNCRASTGGGYYCTLAPGHAGPHIATSGVMWLGKGPTVNGSPHPDCYNCGGDGYSIDGGPCPACKGTGRRTT